MRELTVPVVVNAVSADDAAASVPDAEVTEEVTVLLSAGAQDEARDLADAGRFDEAQHRLHVAADRLRLVSAGSPCAEELERGEAYGASRRRNLPRHVRRDVAQARDLREPITEGAPIPAGLMTSPLRPARERFSGPQHVPIVSPCTLRFDGRHSPMRLTYQERGPKERSWLI